MRRGASIRAATSLAVAVGAAGLLPVVGCGDDDASDRPSDAGRDAALPADSGPAPTLRPPSGMRDAGMFVPPDAPDAIPAVPEPVPDAALDPDAESPMYAPANCLQLEPGETVERTAELTAARLWHRIDVEGGCPASLLTNVEVAYDAYVLCDSAEPRQIEISMLGADGTMPPRLDALADPLLAVYANASQLYDDPFACLAANDDGLIDGLFRSSARIANLSIPTGMRVVVIASSHEPPDQRGVGPYVLTLTAQ